MNLPSDEKVICPDCYNTDGSPRLTNLKGRCRRCHGTGVILTSNELTPKQLAAVLRTLARGYHVDSGALEALNAAALIVEKATPAHETPAPTSKTNYTRPKGVMGGPCLHCQGSQPEHVGLTCDEVRANRRKAMGKVFAKASAEATLETIKQHLETMIASAEVYVNDEEVITAYKIKTGALHKLIGHLGLTIPVNHPVVKVNAHETCEQQPVAWRRYVDDPYEIRPRWLLTSVRPLIDASKWEPLYAPPDQKAETGTLLCRYCPARFMTAWEHEVHEKEHAQKASEGQS